MILPQLASLPKAAVLQSGDFAIALAILFASSFVLVPETLTVMSLVAPSPSAASILASRIHTALSASTKIENWNVAGFIYSLSAMHEDKSRTSSHTLVSPSMLMRLKETSQTVLSASLSVCVDMLASVVITEIIVAMLG